MPSYNYIPDHLKDHQERAEWTEMQGLIRGSLHTAMVALLFGAAWCALVFYVPGMNSSFLVKFAMGLVFTCILYSVMHNGAGMIGAILSGIVMLFASSAFVAKHVAYMFAISHSSDVPITMGEALHPGMIIAFNFAEGCAMVAATFLCKDGDGWLDWFAEFLMQNPFTGRRV